MVNYGCLKHDSLLKITIIHHGKKEGEVPKLRESNQVKKWHSILLRPFGASSLWYLSLYTCIFIHTDIVANFIYIFVQKKSDDYEQLKKQGSRRFPENVFCASYHYILFSF